MLAHFEGTQEKFLGIQDTLPLLLIDLQGYTKSENIFSGNAIDNIYIPILFFLHGHEISLNFTVKILLHCRNFQNQSSKILTNQPLPFDDLAEILVRLNNEFNVSNPNKLHPSQDVNAYRNLLPTHYLEIHYVC